MKPSVAQSIAKVIGANERGDGYLEGKKLKKYEIADRDDRICIMLANFSCFDTMIDIELEGIEYRIKEERAYRLSSGIITHTFRPGSL